MKTILASACALMLGCSIAMAAAPSPIDRKFAVTASVANTFEIQAARLALQRSNNAEVRDFAQMMIADHQLAQRKLDRAAARTETDAGPMLDDRHEGMLSELQQAGAGDFDSAYLLSQVTAHQETVRMLQDFRLMGEDPSMLAWADESLPVVMTHLRHAEAMAPAATPAM